MLWTLPFAVEVLSWVLLWQHHSTFSTELRLTSEAAQVIVLSLPDHNILATGAVATLISNTSKIDKLRKELCLMRSCLGPGRLLVHLLVPTSNLIIIK